MDDIAAVAGVAKGSVFCDFGSKSGLLAAIITDGVARLREAPRAAADGRRGDEAIGTIRRDAMGVFAAAVAQVRPDSDASPAGAALFGRHARGGLDWLVFQPDRTLDDVRRAVIGAR